MTATARVIGGSVGARPAPPDRRRAHGEIVAAVSAALLLSACGGSSRPAQTSTSQPASSLSAPASAPASPSPSPQAGDAQLQQRLEAALLTQGDLPSGFAATSIPPRADFLAGSDATAVAVFARGAVGGPGAEQIVVTLFGFRDALSAASGLGDAQNAVQALTSLPGASIAVAQIPSSAAIADGTQSYRIAGSLAGIGETGFALYWRRGNIVAGITEFGSDTSLLPSAVQTLAQAQDARLAAAGFSALSVWISASTPVGRSG